MKFTVTGPTSVLTLSLMCQIVILKVPYYAFHCAWRGLFFHDSALYPDTHFSTITEQKCSCSKKNLNKTKKPKLVTVGATALKSHILQTQQ